MTSKPFSRRCLVVVLILSTRILFSQSTSAADNQEAERILKSSPWAQSVQTTVPFSTMPNRELMVQVHWESSAAIRQALIKVFGPESIPRSSEAFYVIAVYPFSLYRVATAKSHVSSAAELAEEMLETCRASSHLSNGKIKRSALKVVPYIRGDRRMFFFLFPRDPAIRPDETEVRFEVHLPLMSGDVFDLVAKFKPREMVYLGRPDF